MSPDNNTETSQSSLMFTKSSEVTNYIQNTFSGKANELQRYLDDCDLANKICPNQWKSLLLIKAISKIQDQARIDIDGKTFEN